MKLKRLEIAGFKSFRERVILDFSAGISAVVGPNGCGKSNIVDAIRFAMGEQRVRSLRGKSMDDIIFNGSEEAAAVGMAEVSLILARGDQPFPGSYGECAEVMVTRRLSRGGESDYFLNRVRCRHLDVREFFMGTGAGARSYSLVEQNSVTAMVEAKPEEIRLYIDEAAGISKYKGRRESALRKLDATRQNMLRLNDIIGEVKTSLASTAKQARRAKQFKELRQEIREGETILAWQAYNDLSGRREQQIAVLNDLQRDALESEVRLLTLESCCEAAKVDVQEEEQKVAAEQDRFASLKSALAIKEQGTAFARNKLQELAAREIKLREELTGISQRQREHGKEADQLTALIAADQAQLEEVKKTIRDQENRLAAARLLARESQREAEEKRSQCYNAATEKTRLDNQLVSLEKNSEEMRKRREASGREESELGGRLRELEERLDRLRNALEEDSDALVKLKERGRLASEEEERAREELREAEETIAELKVDRGGKASRLQSMKEFRDGYAFLNEGARSIMKVGKEGHKGKLNGFSPLGLMADFMDVPKEYETAVEVALGEKLQYVAVSSYSDALTAIGYLKTSGAGRGSFVPLELDGQAPDLPAESGIKGAVRLIDVIGFSGVFRHLGEVLLGDVYLIENLAEGLDLRTHGGTKPVFVTADGDLITTQGVLTGGFSGNGQLSLLKNRREITELELSLSAIDQDIDRWTRQRMEASSLSQRWRDEITEARAAQHRIELQINGKKKDCERYGDEIRRLKQRLTVIALNISQLTEEIDRSRTKHEALKSEIAGKAEQESRLNAELAETKRTWDLLQSGLQDQEQELLKGSVLMATLEQKREANIRTKTRLDDSLAILQRQGQQREREIAASLAAYEELTANIRLEEENLRELYLQYGSVEQSLAEMKEKLRLGKEALRNQELEREQARAVARELAGTISRHEGAIRELSFQMDSLREATAGKYHLDLASWVPETPPATLDAYMLRQQVQDKKALLEKFGEVNLLALTEHEKLKERHEFLFAQMEDLKAAIDSLNKTISRINRITRSRFSDTFREINERFQEVFRVLFPGGRGRLLLTDEENLLETGVDMDIQIPGKRLHGLSLLSGGEKTLAAIALIFAILRYRPAPFLILDEVDAALDDVNIAIFNGLIRDIAEKSQIIMVTHNKLSMEVADSLFGVTMQKKGLSSLISVSLN